MIYLNADSSFMDLERIPTLDEITGIEVTYNDGSGLRDLGYKKSIDFKTGTSMIDAFVVFEPVVESTILSSEIIDEIRRTISRSGLLKEDHRYDDCHMLDGSWEYITLLTEGGEYQFSHGCGLPSRRGFRSVFKKINEVLPTPSQYDILIDR